MWRAQKTRRTGEEREQLKSLVHLSGSRTEDIPCCLTLQKTPQPQGASTISLELCSLMWLKKSLLLWGASFMRTSKRARLIPSCGCFLLVWEKRSNNHWGGSPSLAPSRLHSSATWPWASHLTSTASVSHLHRGTFTPTSSDCNGEFLDSLPSTASDAVMEDWVWSKLPRRQNHTVRELYTAEATDPPVIPRLSSLLTGPFGVWQGSGQTPLMVALRGSLGPSAHVTSPDHFFISLLIHPPSNDYWATSIYHSLFGAVEIRQQT